VTDAAIHRISGDADGVVCSGSEDHGSPRPLGARDDKGVVGA